MGGEPQMRDVMGSTSLHYASAFKQQTVIEILLHNTAVAQRLASEGDQKRVTPLHISCALFASDEDLSAPMQLLAQGAKPWQADVSGAAPRELVSWRTGQTLS